MAVRYTRPSGSGSVVNALLLLILVAAGARVAYELLAPLVPALVALLFISFILLGIFRR